MQINEETPRFIFYHDEKLHMNMYHIVMLLILDVIYCCREKETELSFHSINT